VLLIPLVLMEASGREIRLFEINKWVFIDKYQHLAGYEALSVEPTIKGWNTVIYLNKMLLFNSH